MVIYKITNKINHKIYIGQTVKTLKQRWKGHLNDSKIAKNNKFYNAIKKYGTDLFEKEIIENNIATIEELNQREIYWIEFYDSYRKGYNSTLGGKDSPMYYKEACKK